MLICNAGTLENDTLDTLDFHVCRHHYDVNALGPLRTVCALRDRLRAGSKVVLIGSKLGSIGSNTSGARVRLIGTPARPLASPHATSELPLRRRSAAH